MVKTTGKDYNNDSNIIQLNCLYCGKHLERALGRKNEYFCSRFCQVIFTGIVRKKFNIGNREAVKLIMSGKLKSIKVSKFS